MDDAAGKFDCLRTLIAAENALAVAYSGGVDSTFLLSVARQILGDRVIAVTAHTPLMPESERRFAALAAASMGVRQVIVSPDVMGNAELVANPSHRCYICKKAVFTEIVKKAGMEGFGRVAHGANVDDLLDYRPGIKASEELGVWAPLIAAELGKEDIRRISRQLGLPSWDRPSMSCLASRIPYGTPITVDVLTMIERAETVLGSLGITQCRVRAHGTVARIEVDPGEFHLVMKQENRERIVGQLLDIGFAHVALDMEGYQTGRMNRVLKNSPGEP